MSKKEQIKKQEETNIIKKRQIIIETDGSKIDLVKAEVAGSIELIATLQAVIGFLLQQKK